MCDQVAYFHATTVQWTENGWMDPKSTQLVSATLWTKVDSIVIEQMIFWG